MTVAIQANIGPRGLTVVNIVNQYYAKSNELVVSSAYREHEDDGGTWSYHNGVIFYRGSPTMGVDFSENDSVVGSYQGDHDHPAARAMRDFAKWWYDHFGDLTAEMFHTTPYTDDNGFNVREQQKGVPGIPKHGNHIHLGMSAALVAAILDRIRAWGWQPLGSTQPLPTPLPPAEAGPIPGTQPGNPNRLFIGDLYDFTWNMGLRENHVLEAQRQGMFGWNTKFTELSTDGRWTHTNAMRLLNAGVDAGLPQPMGFIVPRTGVSVENQVDYLLTEADRYCGWWRNHPTFKWQVDVEAWPYDRVSPNIGRDVAQHLMSTSKKPVFYYASAGQYRNEIPRFAGRVLWNANYNGSGARRSFKDMYMGDGAPGWVQYSGGSPSLLQYCSDGLAGGWVPNTSEGGLAMTVFRGSHEDFHRLGNYALSPYAAVTPLPEDDMALYPDYEKDFRALIWRVEAVISNRQKVAGGPLEGETNAVRAELDAIKAKLAEVQAGGGNVDLDVLADLVVDKVKARL